MCLETITRECGLSGHASSGAIILNVRQRPKVRSQRLRQYPNRRA